MSSAAAYEREVEGLNFQLEDLGSVPARFALQDLVNDAAEPGAAFRETCGELLQRLSFYDRSISCDEQAPSMPACFEAIGHRSPSFTLQQPDAKLRLLKFLCTELQCERMVYHRTHKAARKAEEQSRGRMLFGLEKMCKTLGMSPSSPAAEEIVQEVIDKIAEVKATTDAAIIHNPPTVLREVALSDQQRALLEEINTAFIQDFALRRRMLLKRLDVTIQSFLWGNEEEGKDQEIVHAIEGQRQVLTEEPYRYTLDDVLATPMSAIVEQTSKAVAESGEKSLVKRIVIGHVPDRGGRANEMRPSARDVPGHRGHGHGHGGGGHKGGKHQFKKRKN